MIHYMGTPCGGTRQDVVRFLTGRHALIPFPYPEDLPTAAEVCQSFCFDNGAFTVWRKGGVLDVGGYIEWCREWSRHPGFDWALIPDVIDGTAEQNDDLVKAWPDDVRGVPVYHLHESIERLRHLAESWSIVAIGSSGQWPTPGTDGWWRRIGEIMPAITDERGRPACKLHGLRMLNPEIFTRLPLSSADSTNAAQNGGSISRFGMYPAPTAGARAAIIAQRIEAHNSAAVWVPSEQPELFQLEATSCTR